MSLVAMCSRWDDALYTARQMAAFSGRRHKVRRLGRLGCWVVTEVGA
jgi:hypothetical protein